jgi:protein-S-isoprenylcysteine O-methyltransferase Ste14
MRETGYLLQAALICAWWAGLATSDTFLAAFQFDQISPTSFWAFFAPDILLIASLSLLRAYHSNTSIQFVILGGFGYASLYCCNASLLTGSGFLPTGLMLLGLAYNLLLCFGDSFFRVTQTTDVTTNAFKTSIQVVCIWLIALAVVPYIILDAFGATMVPTSRIGWALGGLLFACSSLLGLASAYYVVREGGGTPLPLDQTRHLVENGPYQFVRNPMAVAGIGQGISIAIIFLSLPILVYALLGAIVWHMVVRPFEEQDLANRFGDTYLSYRRRVRSWLPKLRRGEQVLSRSSATEVSRKPS